MPCTILIFALTLILHTRTEILRREIRTQWVKDLIIGKVNKDIKEESVK